MKLDLVRDFSLIKLWFRLNKYKKIKLKIEHIYGFNEEFNWDKLNIFSSKKKEELKKKEEVNEDDEALAKAIYSAISGKVKGDEITGDGGRTSFGFEYDGDKFSAGTGSFSVNGQRIDCSKEISTKFYELFKSKKESAAKDRKESEKKSVKDKLKTKYNK